MIIYILLYITLLLLLYIIIYFFFFSFVYEKCKLSKQIKNKVLSSGKTIGHSVNIYGILFKVKPIILITYINNQLFYNILKNFSFFFFFFFFFIYFFFFFFF